jgi:hypothetical protein
MGRDKAGTIVFLKGSLPAARRRTGAQTREHGGMPHTGTSAVGAGQRRMRVGKKGTDTASGRTVVH